MATDAAGNIYVVGREGEPTTTSGGKTALIGTDNPHAPGTQDLWVVKVAPRGEVLWLRMLGGSSVEQSFGIAVLTTGDVAVAGVTSSPDWPGVPSTDEKPSGGLDPQAFVTVLDRTRGAVRWSRLLGGPTDDVAWAVSAAAAGGVTVAGYTIVPAAADTAADRPVRAAGQAKAGDVIAGFVTSLSAAGATRWSHLLKPTRYLADDRDNDVNILAATTGRDGTTVVTGVTRSPYLPATRGAVQPRMTRGAGEQGFVAAYRPDGRGLAWLTYLGGRGATHPRSIAAGPSGSVAVAGETDAANFPQVGAGKATCGDESGFVAELTAGGRRLTKASCLRGTQQGVQSVAYRRDGALLLTGLARPDAPFREYRGLATQRGLTDAYLSVIDAAGRVRTSTRVGGSDTDFGFGVAALPDGDVVVVGATWSADFCGAQAGDPDGPRPVGPTKDRWSNFITRLHNA